MSDYSALAVAEEIAKQQDGMPKDGNTPGSFNCFCPVHESGKKAANHTRSLSVDVDEEKNIVLVKCYAGCSQGKLLRELASRKLYLSPPREKTRRRYKEHLYHNLDGTLHNKVIRKADGGRFQLFYANGKEYKRVRDIPAQAKWKAIPYNYPRVVEAIKQGTPIALCEGEPDCDALDALKSYHGLTPTTNLGGAGVWSTHAADWAKYFIDADVVLFYDMDEAGVERLENAARVLHKVARRLRVVDLVADLELWWPGYDVDDYLGHLGAAEECRIDAMKRLNKLIEATPEYNPKEKVQTFEVAEAPAKERPKGKQKRIFADYSQTIKLIKSLKDIKSIRRCVLADEAIITFRNNEQRKALNCIPEIISEIGDENCRPVSEQPWLYETSANKIEGHIKRYARTLERELVLDIPAWDKRDRIHEIAQVLRFYNLTPDQSEQLLKDWGANIFRRLHAPKHDIPQPAMIILNGPQGCGKDSLIKALTGGFDDYVKSIRIDSISSQEELMRMLHSGLVFVVSEFTRTRKTDINYLKAIVTQEFTNERLKYEKSEEKRLCRGSFIASANNFKLRDSQNRRYWLFQCEYMGIQMRRVPGKPHPQGTRTFEKPYPGCWGEKEHVCLANQRQIVAQFKALYLDKFRADDDVIELMEMQVAELSPPDREDELLRDFDQRLADYRYRHHETAPYGVTEATVVHRCRKDEERSSLWVKNCDEIRNIIRQIKEDNDYYKLSEVMDILEHHGRRQRFSDACYYRGHGPGGHWINDIASDDDPPEEPTNNRSTTHHDSDDTDEGYGF